MTDVNGDTRTVSTRFAEVSPIGPAGPPGPPGPSGLTGLKLVVKCELQSQNTIKCTVTFKRASKAVKIRGKLQVRIARGARVAALGHASVRSGKVTLKMRRLRKVVRGKWTMTAVLTQTGGKPATMKQTLRLP